MYFLEEIGKFRKFLVLHYQIFLIRQFLVEIVKILMNEIEKLIFLVKSDSKEELELNRKEIVQKVARYYHYKLIQIFGLSKIKKSSHDIITVSNVDLNKAKALMDEIEKEIFEKFGDFELLTNYFHLDERNAKDLLESFIYLEMGEKSLKKFSKAADTLFHTQRIFDILKKIGHISYDRDKNYSQKTYLKLIGFLLHEYKSDNFCGRFIRSIHQKIITSFKKSPSETFKLLSLFFEHKTKFRNIYDILTKDRIFHYLTRELGPDFESLAPKVSTQIKQEFSKSINKIEKITDIPEAVEQVLYSDKNPAQLLIESFNKEILKKISEIIQFREESSNVIPQVRKSDGDHVLELYRNMYEGEYWLLLGFLICLEMIIQKGSFNKNHILTENYVKNREEILVNLNPTNNSLILFNNRDVTPRRVDAHNKVSYNNDFNKIQIRGSSKTIKIDELEQKTREKAKILLACYNYIDFIEIFISNFIANFNK